MFRKSSLSLLTVVQDLEDRLRLIDIVTAKHWEHTIGSQPPASRRGDVQLGWAFQDRDELLSVLRIRLDAYCMSQSCTVLSTDTNLLRRPRVGYVQVGNERHKQCQRIGNQ